jgi:hypothetical protein
VLRPSDSHRKLIKSITAVLLPFVIYLLTLPRMYNSSGTDGSNDYDFSKQNRRYLGPLEDAEILGCLSDF